MMLNIFSWLYELYILVGNVSVQVFWPFIPVSFCLIWSIVYKSSFVISVYNIIWVDYKMASTISLVTVCYHTNNYSMIHCIPYAVYYIPVTYFVTGSLYFLVPFTYFAQTPTLVPFWQPPIVYKVTSTLQSNSPNKSFPDNKQYQVIYPFPKSSCSANLCSIIMTWPLSLFFPLYLNSELCFQVSAITSHSAININTCSK